MDKWLLDFGKWFEHGPCVNAYTKYFSNIGDESVEQFVMLFIKDEKVNGSLVIAYGDENEVDLPDDLSVYVPKGIHNVVVAHNHPGTYAFPSLTDDELTENIYKDLKKKNINLLDHVIISNHEGGCFSYAEMKRGSL